MNKKNNLGLDICFMDEDNPFVLFKHWMSEAEKKEINDPNAVALATVNETNQPDVRMVLLKEFNNNGFVFFTNLNSKKGSDLKKNPKASMCFHWKSLLRQVRISGDISLISNNDADEYFNSRPYLSKIGAWSSNQSKPMEKRDSFLNKIEEYKNKFSDQNNVPRPKHWSGFLLSPNKMEFWKDVEGRLHQRLEYLKDTNFWKKQILYP
ncbi:pyridoxamine 5'-phosphate oxidase [Candidatus Pelagibacter sp.]|nr:pyridoxamine 5'-phosphate oxidase [Candidatus Pelagibacter sp.]|tara:strand:+ start:917 stop:1540 length:624 start_codon:yes stop_codon:yes gene_type:complete